MSLSNFVLCYWAIFVLNWSLDGFCYLFTGAMINLILAIPLIYAKRPIRFDPQWEEIYTNYFQHVLSRYEFKRIKEVTNMRIRRRNVPGTTLCDEANPFESIYLITRIPEGAEVKI